MKPETNAKICQTLSIQPIDERPGHAYADHDGTSDCDNGCGAWMGPFRSGAPTGVDPFGECPLAAPVYPDLATEAGFFILWAALKRNGWSTCAVDDGKDCWAKLSRPGAEVRSGYYDTAPQALLMAAALALGVADE